MNKVIPITGLVIFLLVVGIWLSRPNPSPAGTVTAQSEETTETSSDETSEEATEETIEDSNEESTTQGSEEEHSENADEDEAHHDGGEEDHADSENNDAEHSDSTEESQNHGEEGEEEETHSDSVDADGEDMSEDSEMAEEDESEASNEMSPLVIPEGYSKTPLISDTQLQVFEQAEQVIKEGKDYQALIQTNKGTIRVELFEDEVPNTINNFVFLAGNKYFDGIIFHRVLEGFMAQTGDPTGTGRGDPGYKFEDEFNENLSHDKPGILSMANSGVDTNGSQFFITFEATPWLDNRHSVFGEVIEGEDVLDKLTRIDPSSPSPSVIAKFSDPISTLTEQNINLDGDPDMTIEDFLTETLGELPEIGSSFSLADYDAIAGRVAEDLAIGFFPPVDVMQSVVIIERDKE